LHVSGQEVEAVVARETQEIERREKLYRDALPAAIFRGRTVVLVDDGLATGSARVAAARYVRSLHSQRLIIAVPVGSAQACIWTRREADECICLAAPEPLLAVGEWYADFRQVTDAEVQQMLRCNHSRVSLLN
jgi:putative phosphoribosyl transferase